jgi:hypothetical protein
MYGAFTDKLKCNRHFLTGNASLNAKYYRIFPIQVSHNKTIKSTYLYYKG